MKKYHAQHYSTHAFQSADGPSTEIYIAAEVDARIAELEKALREAIQWNWNRHAPSPAVEAMVSKALMGREA